jgi:hypothetical protein
LPLAASPPEAPCARSARRRLPGTSTPAPTGRGLPSGKETEATADRNWNETRIRSGNRIEQDQEQERVQDPAGPSDAAPVPAPVPAPAPVPGSRSWVPILLPSCVGELPIGTRFRRHVALRRARAGQAPRPLAPAVRAPGEERARLLLAVRVDKSALTRNSRFQRRTSRRLRMASGSGRGRPRRASLRSRCRPRPDPEADYRSRLGPGQRSNSTAPAPSIHGPAPQLAAACFSAIK